MLDSSSSLKDYSQPTQQESAKEGGEEESKEKMSILYEHNGNTITV